MLSSSHASSHTAPLFRSVQVASGPQKTVVVDKHSFVKGFAFFTLIWALYRVKSPTLINEFIILDEKRI